MISKLIAVPLLALSLAGCSAGAKVDWAGVSGYIKENATFENACKGRHQAYQLFQGVYAIIPNKISDLAVQRVDQAYAVANAVCESPVPQDARQALDTLNVALSAIAKEVAEARAKSEVPK